MATRRAICLKVTLLEIEPAIWRRFAVSGSIALPKLHRVLQEVMGWQDCHLHQFRFGDATYGPVEPSDPHPLIEERGKRLRDLLPADGVFDYEYDFGDGWTHRVEVVHGIEPAELASLPACLDGARACPPEDVGGPWSYADFLEAIRDPAHEEHESYLKWLGTPFDPEAFDVAEVNRRLRSAP